MIKYLIFRTDRIGDFLLTAILINSIKRNNPQSYIIVVASENNYDYIKSFKNNNLINQLISLTLITFSISFNLEIESSSTAFSTSIKL